LHIGPRRRTLLSHTPRILIVDDEPSIQILFEEVLSEIGYHVTVVGKARQALAQLRNRDFDLVILDLSLPDGDGLDMVRQIRSEFLDLKILATSGFMVGDMPNVVMASGASDALRKPTSPDQLCNSVYQLLDASGGWRGDSVKLGRGNGAA
jgi:DNA-binding response OmpR family regulator